MKILQTGDFHCTADEMDAKDIDTAIDQVCAVADAEQVNLVVVAGDVFDCRLPVDSIGVRCAIRSVSKLASVAPVVVLRGTATHDVGESLKILESIKTEKRLRVVSEPAVFNGNSKSGSKVAFYCMPGMRKRMFAPVASHYGVDMMKTTASELVDLQMKFWSENREQVDDSIMIGHFHVDKKEFAIMESGYEPLVSCESIARYLNPSLVMLGHIHEPYSDGRFFHAGSLTARNMHDAMVYDVDKGKIVKDKSSKGFFIHESEAPGRWESKFVELEGRRFLKVLASHAAFGKIGEAVDRVAAEGRPMAVKIEANIQNPNGIVKNYFDELLAVESDMTSRHSGRDFVILPSSVNVQSFNVSRRLSAGGEEGSGADPAKEWGKLRLDGKVFRWADEKGYQLPADELEGYSAKINSL